MLPSGPVAEHADRPDAAGGLRAEDRGDRQRVPLRALDDRPAHRARQGEDPGCVHPLPGAVARRSPRTVGLRAVRHLSRVQRGLLGLIRRVADAARSLGRGDSPGATAPRAPAGSGGDGTARPDAAPGVARAARSSPEGDLVLLEDQDRSLWNREQIAEGEALVERALASRRFGSYTIQAAIAAVHAGGTDRRGDGLGADRGPVRRARASAAVARRGTESGGGGGDARWAVGRAANGSTRSWPVATWPTTTWHTRRGPISAGGWEGRPRPENPTGGRWRSPGRSRSVGSSNDASANWAEKFSPPLSIRPLRPDDYSSRSRRSRSRTPSIDVAASDRDRVIPRRPNA